LNIIGQEDHFSTDSAARSFDLSHAPHPVHLARTEREPGSVGAVEEITALDPSRDLNLLPSAVTPDLRHTDRLFRNHVSNRTSALHNSQLMPTRR
jgi:hypothetical protein